MLSYFFVVGAGFFFWTVPYSKAATNEIGERVNSLREKFLIINIFRMSRELFSALAMLLTGVMVEKGKIWINKDTKNFLWILLGNSILIVIFHIGRRIVEKIEKNTSQLHEGEEMDN